MSLPAILNEVLSVTGTYPFPYTRGAAGHARPTRLPGGLAATDRPHHRRRQRRTPGPGRSLLGQAAVVGAGDNIIYADKLLAAANRILHDRLRRPGGGRPGLPPDLRRRPGHYNIFTEAGTSLSAGMVTGSFAVVASAIDYWTELAHRVDAATVDAT